MDIKKFVTVGEDGTTTIDSEAFQREFDAEISRAVEKNKSKEVAKLKDEVRKELEEEAKLTAEEKLTQQMKEFEKYKLDTMISLNQEKAKAKFDGKGFTKEEIEFFLSTVSDNEESITKLDTIIEARAKSTEATKAKLLEDLQKQQDTSKSESDKSGVDVTEPTKTTRSRQDIEQFYTKKTI